LSREGAVYHEAGHEVMAWYLGVAVKTISIFPMAMRLGLCRIANMGKYPDDATTLQAVDDRRTRPGGIA
jgi:hypothetical protein